MKARDELRSATLRMALTAVTTEEVAGKTARELDDDEVVTVLGREAKKRREAAEAFADGGRPDRAERERAEERGPRRPTCRPSSPTTSCASWSRRRSPRPVRPGRRRMGQVMKVVTPQTAGRAEGGRVAAEVRRQLGRLTPSRQPGRLELPQVSAGLGLRTGGRGAGAATAARLGTVGLRWRRRTGAHVDDDALARVHRRVPPRVGVGDRAGRRVGDVDPVAADDRVELGCPQQSPWPRRPTCR